MKILAGGLCVVLSAALVYSQTPTANASCETLASLTLPNTTITRAQAVEAGAFTPPTPAGGTPPPATAGQAFRNLPAFCRVAATLKPSSDSDIKIEVWMPASGWNGKFEAVGNGGWAGTISYPALATALRRGYATASTDTGHSGSGGDASFALGHPEKLIDFGYRAVHEMTVQAKAVVAAFYGNRPRLSYWNGCSSGGKQGLKEAQRFPLDNGTINATDPNLTRFTARGGKLLLYHGWNDPLIAPQNAINYYKSVVSAMGSLASGQDSIRLFMAPGMAHCGGGEGPNSFDMMTAIEQWVEQGKAPDQLAASHSTDGKVDRTRPLCRYPQVARYKGTGSTDDAASFVCAIP